MDFRLSLHTNSLQIKCLSQPMRTWLISSVGLEKGSRTCFGLPISNGLPNQVVQLTPKANLSPFQKKLLMNVILRPVKICLACILITIPIRNSFRERHCAWVEVSLFTKKITPILEICLRLSSKISHFGQRL